MYAKGLQNQDNPTTANQKEEGADQTETHKARHLMLGIIWKYSEYSELAALTPIRKYLEILGNIWKYSFPKQ